MKQSIAIAMLLAAVSETVAMKISKPVHVKGKFEQNLISMGMSSSDSDKENVEEDDDYEAIQIKQHGIAETQEDFHGYHPWYNGFEGNHHNGIEWRDAYDRNETMPEVFTGDNRDTFTAKMITEYALEGHDEVTGAPNGKFTLSKDKTKLASYEVLETHLGLSGADADAHLAKYFDQVWDHMDVNKTGRLEAVELQKFMRDLCKPVKEHIYLE